MQSSVTKWVASERQTFEDKEDKGKTVKRQSSVACVRETENLRQRRGTKGKQSKEDH